MIFAPNVKDSMVEAVVIGHFDNQKITFFARKIVEKLPGWFPDAPNL